MIQSVSSGYTMPPEWAPQEALWLSWPVADPRHWDGKKAELVARLEEYDRDLTARMAASPPAMGEIDFDGMGLDEIGRAAREAAELFTGEEPSDEVLMMLENEQLTFDDDDGNAEEITSRRKVMDYASMNVKELKDELKSRGLKVGGKKADLIERLKESD